MKNRKKIGIIILITVLLVCIIVVTYVLSRPHYRSVKLDEYEGSVSLTRQETTIEPYKGIKLIPGDFIEAMKDSFAVLFVDNDKHLGVKENTKLSINATGTDTNGKVTVDLEYGEALFEIENKLNTDSSFEVTTPNAILAVRGTTFDVNYSKEDNTSKISVADGTVAVNYGADYSKQRLLNAGESIIIADYDVISDTEASEEVEERDIEFLDDGVLMGEYEGTPLKWNILEDSGDTKLLILDCSLPARDDIKETEYAIWRDSKLRKWLNSSFYTECFTDKERSHILLSNVLTSEVTNGIPETMAWGAETETQDYIYCLSIKEYTQYYNIDNWGYMALYAYSKEGICAGIGNTGRVVESEATTQDVYNDSIVGMLATTYYLRDTSPGGAEGLGDAPKLWAVNIVGATQSYIMIDHTVDIRPVMRISSDNLTE